MRWPGCSIGGWVSPPAADYTRSASTAKTTDTGITTVIVTLTDLPAWTANCTRMGFTTWRSCSTGAQLPFEGWPCFSGYFPRGGRSHAHAIPPQVIGRLTARLLRAGA